MSLGPIANAALQGLTGPGAVPAPIQPPATPSVDDVARFNGAMGGNDSQAAAAAGPASIGDVGQVHAAGGPDTVGMADPAATSPLPAPAAMTPGDAILQGLQRMNGDFHASLEGLSGMMNLKQGETMSSADLLKAQLSLTQVTMQQDVTSKVVGKVTQDLDTFLKNG